MISEIEINLETKSPECKLAALHIITGTKNSATQSSRQRILCVHGWLDNANSFYPLLPLLENAEIVAIDLPGHGHSDHLNSTYSIPTFAHIVLAAAKALGWDTFTLIGHSLGGCIAPFSAVAADDKINRLILIEAAGPVSEAPTELPQRLKKFHTDMEAPLKYQSRLFDSIEQAISSRLRANKMTPESARLIVERQLQEVTDDTLGQDQPTKQWKWRFDSKLRATSPSYFTEEQVQSVLEAVECPVLCILADEGYLHDRKETQDRLKQFKDCRLVTLPGHHHLHLDAPNPVANEINQFLS